MKKYKEIVEHYEGCLEKHGDNHLGVDWPNLADADKRYEVMLGVMNYAKNLHDEASLLDFGCGTAHLKAYIDKVSKSNINYAGLDLSQKFVDVSKNKYPECSFYCMDILENDKDLPSFDFIVMNGVFTEKRGLSFEEMWQYFTDMIAIVYGHTKVGLAFNVMSKNVDWEREDLFHLPLDLLTGFLCKNITRDFIIRNDYGLYEYTVYIFKK